MEDRTQGESFEKGSNTIQLANLALFMKRALLLGVLFDNISVFITF